MIYEHIYHPLLLSSERVHSVAGISWDATCVWHCIYDKKLTGKKLNLQEKNENKVDLGVVSRISFFIRVNYTQTSVVWSTRTYYP